MTGFIHIYYLKEVNANATILVRQEIFYLEERILRMQLSNQGAMNNYHAEPTNCFEKCAS